VDLAPCQLDTASRVAERALELLIEEGRTTQGDDELHVGPVCVRKPLELCLCDLLHSPSFHGRLALGSGHDRSRRRRHRVSFELVVAQQVEISREEVDLAGADEPEVLVGEDFGELVVAERRGVRQRFFDQAVGVEPLPSGPVKPRHDLRVRARQLDLQQLPKEVVVAVPLPSSVESDEEEVGALEIAEQSSRILHAEDGLARPR
jgi:hypothetical protein